MNDVTISLAGMQDLEVLCRLYVEFHEFYEHRGYRTLRRTFVRELRL